MSTEPIEKEEPTENDWSYPASGDIDLRAPYVTALVESDDMSVSLEAPKEREVTLTMTLNADGNEDIAGGVVNLTPADASKLGRDLLAAAAGSIEKSRGQRAAEAVIEQRIAELQAELDD